MKTNPWNMTAEHGLSEGRGEGYRKDEVFSNYSRGTMVFFELLYWLHIFKEV